MSINEIAVSERQGREAPPFPPEGPPASLPELVRVEVLAAWRLHWEDDTRDPPAYPRGRWRFDAPLGEYRVTYFNLDPYAAFAEVYGDIRSIAPNQATRTLSTMWAERELAVVDLDSAETLAALGLDLRISASVDYERTMAWSRSLHDWYPKADGICYLGRHAAKHLNFCLFLDRCSDALRFEAEGTLADLRPHVLRAADAYNLAPRLFEPRDRGTVL